MSKHGQEVSSERTSEEEEAVTPLQPELMNPITPLILEIVLYAHLTCREVENHLSCAVDKMTMTDVLVLTHLGAAGSDTLANISQELNIPKTTLHYALNKMEERMWIARGASGERADQPIFSLTAKGKEQLAQVITTVFHPTKDSFVYDWVASSYEPLVCLAMTLRMIASRWRGPECTEKVTRDALRIASFAKEYGKATEPEAAGSTLPVG